MIGIVWGLGVGGYQTVSVVSNQGDPHRLSSASSSIARGVIS